MSNSTLKTIAAVAAIIAVLFFITGAVNPHALDGGTLFFGLVAGVVALIAFIAVAFRKQA